MLDRVRQNFGDGAAVIPLGRFLAIFLVVSATWATTIVPMARAGAEPADFLVQFGERAVKELNDASLTRNEQERRFMALFRDAVDVPAISRFILGPYWSRATEKSRADFTSALESTAMLRLLPMFTKQDRSYAGESFDIVEVRPGEAGSGQVFVHVSVARKDQPTAILVWRLRAHEESFKILDIVVEGISMALTLREEYGAAIHRLGGLAPLIEEMRRKIESGASNTEAKTPVQ